MSNSPTTTEKWAPVHPGEILMEDFIEGFGISHYDLEVEMDALGDALDRIEPLRTA